MIGRSIRQLLELLRRAGPRWLLFRVRYELSRRLGVHRARTPVRMWEDWPHPAELAMPGFPFEPGKLVLPGALAEQVLEEANHVLAGRFRLFESEPTQLGRPPNWNRSPSSGVRIPADRHWSLLRDLDRNQGDIKFIWELSRFRWAVTLATASSLTGETKWGECFWQLWEDWQLHNPPNSGPQWMCGQECAFRLIALAFCLRVFAAHPASTTQRVQRLWAALAILADRIAGNIDFALWQNNNHGISEAAGLFTAGLLCRWHPRASRWRSDGKRLLESQLLRQVYPDGSYIQHSFVYQRLVLQVCVWSLELGRIHDEHFSPAVIQRLRSSAYFLNEVTDPSSGDVPQYGATDGSNFLPPLFGDYRDFRSVAEAILRVTSGAPWLSGDAEGSRTRPELPARRGLTALSGGYFTLSGPRSWALIRCHSYQDRPSQADMLHLDLWSNGGNVLCDAGTYMYNCEAPWDRYFSSTAAHNTVQVDRLDQMEKGPRFLWFGWTEAAVRHRTAAGTGALEYWEGEHRGYWRGLSPVLHRRGVLRIEDCWVIVDDLLGGGSHELTLRWHLSSGDWRLTEGSLLQRVEGAGWRMEVLAPASDAELPCGRISPEPEGWRSLRYGTMTSHPTLRVRVRGELPYRFVTLFQLQDTAWPAFLENGRVRHPLAPPAGFQLARPALESPFIVNISEAGI